MARVSPTLCLLLIVATSVLCDNCNPTCDTTNILDIFADPTDCTKFFICGPSSDLIPLVCSEGQEFDSKKETCVDSGAICAFCPPSCQLSCPVNSDIVAFKGDINDCSAYYMCLVGGEEIKLTCKDNVTGLYFDGNGCTTDPSKCCKAANSCVPYCQVKNTKISDPYDCSKFYVCIEEGGKPNGPHQCKDGNFSPLSGGCDSMAPCFQPCNTTPTTTTPKPTPNITTPIVPPTTSPNVSPITTSIVSPTATPQNPTITAKVPTTTTEVSPTTTPQVPTTTKAPPTTTTPLITIPLTTPTTTPPPTTTKTTPTPPTTTTTPPPTTTTTTQTPTTTTTTQTTTTGSGSNCYDSWTCGSFGYFPHCLNRCSHEYFFCDHSSSNGGQGTLTLCPGQLVMDPDIILCVLPWDCPYPPEEE